MLSPRSLEHPAGALFVVGVMVFLSHLAALNAGTPLIPTQEDPGAEKESSDPQKCFVVLFTKGHGYVKGGPQPGMEEHVKFIKARHAEGVVPLAGALFEGNEKPG